MTYIKIALKRTNRSKTIDAPCSLRMQHTSTKRRGPQICSYNMGMEAGI